VSLEVIYNYLWNRVSIKTWKILVSGKALLQINQMPLLPNYTSKETAF